MFSVPCGTVNEPWCPDVSTDSLGNTFFHSGFSVRGGGAVFQLCSVGSVGELKTVRHWLRGTSMRKRDSVPSGQGSPPTCAT